MQEQQAAHKASLTAAESALRKAEAATASAEGAASAANGDGGAEEVQMRLALNGFMRSVLDAMKPYVALERLLNKILDDHKHSKFGEFRGVIMGMLDAYRYEERIMTTAARMLRDDVYRLVQYKHARLAQGFLVKPLELAAKAKAKAKAAAAAGGGGGGDDDAQARSYRAMRKRVQMLRIRRRRNRRGPSLFEQLHALDEGFGTLASNMAKLKLEPPLRRTNISSMGFGAAATSAGFGNEEDIL